MRTISAGGAGLAGCITVTSAPPEGVPGEPAIAAAAVPSKVTFGQPTGSCGTKAVKATGGWVAVERRSKMGAVSPANPAEGGNRHSLERAGFTQSCRQDRSELDGRRLRGEVPTANRVAEFVETPGKVRHF
jgi:hypothetical protein